jgi:hypothetical protein
MFKEVYSLQKRGANIARGAAGLEVTKAHRSISAAGRCFVYMRQQALLRLDRVDFTDSELLLGKPELPDIPKRMRIRPRPERDLIDLEAIPAHQENSKQRR